MLTSYNVREFDDDPSCIVWPAARILLHWLYHHLESNFGETLRGSTVLDLGAGTGFLALSLATEAKHVVAVEGSELGFSNLEFNISKCNSLNVTPVFWNWEAQPGIPPELPEKLDIILGSDIVYPRYYDCDALCETVSCLLGRSLAKEPLALFALCERASTDSSSNNFDFFFEACTKRLLKVSEFPISNEILTTVLGAGAVHGEHDDPGGGVGVRSCIRLFRIQRSE